MSNAFVLEAMDLDGVSVGRNSGTLEVICRDHDGVNEIETEDIHDLVKRHGLEVSNTIVDFDAGEVRHIVDGIGGGSGND